jgi:hypothetical protein
VTQLFVVVEADSDRIKPRTITPAHTKSTVQAIACPWASRTWKPLPECRKENFWATLTWLATAAKTGSMVYTMTWQAPGYPDRGGRA